MKKILILLLIALWGCNDENMEISNACEIQFWPTGTSSFNEETNGYTEEGYCFHQKFLCTSQRSLQGIEDEDPSAVYYLMGFDEEENILINSAYTKEEIFQTVEVLEFANEGFFVTPSPSLAGWSQYSDSPSTSKDWIATAYGPTSVAAAVGGSGVSRTYEIYAPRKTNGIGGYSKFPPGSYTFKLNLANDSSGGLVPLQEGLVVRAFNLTSDVGEQIIITIPRGGGFLDYEVTLVTTQPWAYISFMFYKQGPSSGSTIDIAINTIEITNYPLDYSYTVHSKQFIPSDNGMCDKKVQFKIFDGNDPESDNELFHSDSIDFVSVWANGPNSGRVVVQFKSIQNYAGLHYTSGSPYFNLEIDGRFRKERQNSTVKEVETTENIINTAAVLRTQKKLEINDQTSYMHRKVLMALSHAASGSVLIGGVEYSIGEAYTESEDAPNSYPLSPAEIWLTEKNSLLHNVI